ncbi:MAG: hypothetical protein QG588_2331 [Candidatus Poribacteria bacterium]|nr:hypothetical protein [Candidatus Poribacteria bacterium]
MREQTCDAVFKNGVFQPLNVSEIEITEGQKVKLIIEPLDSSEDILELASSVYKGLKNRLTKLSILYSIEIIFSTGDHLHDTTRTIFDF